MSDLRLVGGHVPPVSPAKFGRFYQIYDQAVAYAFKDNFQIPKGWKLENATSAYILSVWLRNEMNYTQAARELNMGRATIYRKLQELEVSKEVGEKLHELALETR